MTTSLLLCLIASAAPFSRAAAPAPLVASSKPTAKMSAEAAFSTTTVSPSTIYTADRLRDPFLPFSGTGGGGAITVAKPFTLDQFNIHNLSLRGIMKDSSADYALFSDPTLGVTFILRRGKLYDSRNRVVPGVLGKLKVKEKWAQLETSDHDVQIFRLGEEEKD